MADRWSRPSGSYGIERFRVWPSGTDSYDSAELADNWDAIDAIIGHPPTGTDTNTFGNATTGTENLSTQANRKEVSKFVMTEYGQVTKLTGYLKGDGAASMSMRGVIYTDSAGDPDAFLGSTAEVTIALGDEVYAWRDFSFAVPVALEPGTYWIGYHTDAGRYTHKDTGVSGDGFYNATDTYGDGSAATFGAGTATDFILSIYATYDRRWPQEEGLDAGVYGAFNAAAAGSIPVGAIFPWIKASEDAEVPDGFEICDGRVVSDHEFPNEPRPLTLPDMRNKTVLGASLTAEDGYGGDPTSGAGVNNFAGSPAIGGTGGRNAITLTEQNLAAHRHTGSLTGWSTQMETWYDNDGGKYPQSGNFETTLTGDSNSIGTGGGGYQSGQHRHKLDGLSADGGGKAHDNRPMWVGLVWIMKVRNAV